MFQLIFDKNKAWVTERETLTVYSQGYDAAEIGLSLSEEWSSLSKIAVFRAYDTQIDVAVTGNSVEIPANVLLKPNVHLLFGLYGVSTDGTTVISTVGADLGIIQPAANPTDADNYGPPALGLYAQVAALAEAAQAAAATAASGTYAGSVTFSINDSGHMIMTVTNEGTPTETDLGPVSAYAAAVAGGYTGTYAEFQALLIANGATAYNVAQALEAVQSVTDTANAARTAAASAVSTASAAQTAAAAATSAASAAQTAANGKQSKYKTATVTLAANNTTWTDLTATGVTANNLVFWGAAPASFDAAAAALVHMTAQGDNTVSFAADTAPEEDLTFNLAIFDP
jgi:hypothetical protein